VPPRQIVLLGGPDLDGPPVVCGIDGVACCRLLGDRVNAGSRASSGKPPGSRAQPNGKRDCGGGAPGPSTVTQPVSGPVPGLTGRPEAVVVPPCMQRPARPYPRWSGGSVARPPAVHRQEIRQHRRAGSTGRPGPVISLSASWGAPSPAWQPHAFAPAGEPRHHRADGHPKHAWRFGVTQVLDRDQKNDRRAPSVRLLSASGQAAGRHVYLSLSDHPACEG
jgi:hypothetical protein